MQFVSERLAGVDWSDLASMHAHNLPLLKELAGDKALLRKMVLNARNDPRLFAMCERHFLLDYFVLHADDADRFRLRLHLHTDNHKERPHNHRFSFTTYIMRGHYDHFIHDIAGGIGPHTTVDDLTTRYRTREVAGSSYTTSYDTVHTTYTRPDTVSLIVRGPAVLDRSIIIDRETRQVSWRVSRPEEGAERRKRVSMTRQDCDMLIHKLEKLDVI